MESLRENRTLFFGLLTAAVVTITITLQISSDLTWFFELVPLPLSHRLLLLSVMCADFAVCWIWEFLVSLVFRR